MLPVTAEKFVIVATQLWFLTYAEMSLAYSLPYDPALPDLENLALDGERLSASVIMKKEIRPQMKTLNDAEKATGREQIEEDALLTTPQIISKYGYPVEKHEIVTEDGYILTFHRIPYGKNCKTKVVNSRPLYLQHGLMSSSDDWIITGPEKGFGYILADAGYDVWIGNARGNKWSRRHVRMNPQESKFWDFSWHEMGFYDLPAAIDYILKVSEQKQLFYVGHSMGNTMFAVMGAERPEYNAKIRVAAILAPSILYAHVKTSVFSDIFVRYPRQVEEVLTKRLGIFELLNHHPVLTSLGASYCKDGDKTQRLCLRIAELIGVNTEQLNKTILPLLMAHFPSGSSTKTFLHFAQCINTGEFRQYDRGDSKNMIKYGIIKPPRYDVTKITAPTALYYAENDGVFATEDTFSLAELLPNVISVNRIPNEKFNHLDFVIANQAKTLVYYPIIKLFDQF